MDASKTGLEIIREREREAMKQDEEERKLYPVKNMMSMKGKPCIYLNGPVTCQEGDCKGCQIYLNRLKKK